MAKNLDELLDGLASEFGSREELEAQCAEAAVRLGLDPGDVNVRMDVLVTNMCRDGVLVDLHVGRTRFMRRLDEQDLGLAHEDEEHRKFLQEYVRLGNKFLLNSKYLQILDSLERNGRRTVEKYGFKTRWGIFVPYKNFALMREKIEEIKKEYFAVRDEILDRYDQLKEETRRVYERAALESYRMIKRDRYAVVPEEFTRAFVDGVMALFPDKEHVRDSFYFDLDVGFVPLTSVIEEERVRVEMIRRKEEILRERARTLIMEEHYKQEQIRAIHREALESYRRGVNEFLQQTVGYIYNLVYEACEAVRLNVEKNGQLHSGDTRRLKTLIEKLNRLNFNNDQAVQRYLDQLREIVEAEERSPRDVKRSLDAIASETRQTLLLLGCEPRRIRAAAEVAPLAEEVHRKGREKRAGEPVLELFVENTPVRKKRAAAI
ncbi:DUF3150 domain-containing protein [Desulfofundulus sp.]|uniref:DUF3150 domain-containing protein n=1 Tax=Desulfofundulus sp. TaxID=2282750 RepID=UPI003C7545D5